MSNENPFGPPGQNPYEPPKSDLDRAGPGSEYELAGRGARLGAQLIDGLIQAIVILPILFTTDYFAYIEQGNPLTLGIILTVVLSGLAVFLLINGYYLYKDGQTVGKKAVGIRIADLDGNVPHFGKLLGLRYVVPMYVIPQIPLIGGIFGLVNILFIFRTDRRCIHDLMADTRVVVA